VKIPAWITVLLSIGVGVGRRSVGEGEKVFRRDTFGVAQSPRAFNGGTLIMLAALLILARAF
jgi:hypothetical protein